MLCPIMMIFCMKGMGHSHHGNKNSDEKIMKLEAEVKILLNYFRKKSNNDFYKTKPGL
ncbi:DUF2933 domain-containing protein [Neobacillus piezotolerans]|uniref:DUF2933 domain-containing protein n=1 Tax=Neobacillus piezotolerans TaxID=2259171 RepID=UPI003F6E3091